MEIRISLIISKISKYSITLIMLGGMILIETKNGPGSKNTRISSVYVNDNIFLFILAQINYNNNNNNNK